MENLTEDDLKKYEFDESDSDSNDDGDESNE